MHRRKYLHWAKWNYNTTHSSTGLTTFQVAYEKPPSSLPTYLLCTSKLEAVDTILATREEILKTLRQNLLQVQQNMKKKVDAHKIEYEFQMDDRVFLKLQQFRQNTMAHRKNHKLSQRYFGPFQISQKICPVTYKLILPLESRIHPAFRISL